ncbi:MAG: hypothetical protein JWM40_3055, partial [Frankiales bacterium]|nr:hypothetical protein [Frankiales bacterium]
EILGDVWGRGIRYGEDPPDEDLPVTSTLTRRQLWDRIQQMGVTADVQERTAEALAILERHGSGLAHVTSDDPEAEAWLRAQDEATFKRDLAQAEAEMARQLIDIADIAKSLRT